VKAKYFVPQGKMEDPNQLAQDSALAEKLWSMTEDLLKEKGF
jgi:hypothetical protein